MGNKFSFFKPAKPNTNILNFTKTIIQMILFWLIFLYILPQIIVKIEIIFDFVVFQASVILGWVLFVLFSILGLSSAYTMSWFGKGTPLPLDCPNDLVIAGPYRFVRNPMAVAGIGQAIAVGIVLGSYLVILYALAGAFLWHFVVRSSEEVDLESRFGEPCLMYKQKVKCWLPSCYKM